MLRIHICEDDQIQRKKIETYVENYIMIEDLDAELTQSTENPYDIIKYLERNPKNTGLYFLDINLQNDMNGLELAAKIRDLDTYGRIVFITTHGELTYLTFTYKIEAMDYIIKSYMDNLADRIRDCIKVAYERYLDDKKVSNDIFEYKVGNRIKSVNISDILFFETSGTPHKIVMHLEDAHIEFYSNLKELNEINGSFIRCHESYLVNKENIKYVDRTNRQLVMSNDEICLVSTRGMKSLKQILLKKKLI